jgi:hypothetical protein
MFNVAKALMDKRECNNGNISFQMKLDMRKKLRRELRRGKRDAKPRSKRKT